MRTRIKEFRKASGLTLKQLADAMGTTPQTVQRLETDNMTVSTKWLERFAKALGVRPDELLEDPAAHAATADGRFLAKLREPLIRARRGTPADKAPLALIEAVGLFATHLIEFQSGLRPWEDVHEVCAKVAACAVRIAIDCAPAEAQAAEPVKLVVNRS